jgi:hypothetical protein
LHEFERHYSEKGPVVEDVFVYRGNKQYERHAANLRQTWRIISDNPAQFHPEQMIPIRLWLKVPYDKPKESAVMGLVWKDGILNGVCGAETPRSFTIDRDGNLLSLDLLSVQPTEYQKWLSQMMFPRKNNVETECGAKLPYYPGRQYKAVPDQSVSISGGRRFVATKDGMLAIVKDGGAYSLGPACSHGSVHCMTISADGNTVYGVAGDEDDLGNLFTYDDENGLRWLGLIATDGYQYGSCASYNLTSCALNEDGNILAIGCGDRLGCVYLCILKRPERLDTSHCGAESFKALQQPVDCQVLNAH